MSATSTTRKPSPLREVRVKQGLSLRDVAKESGVDFAYLGRIERGEATGSITTLRKIAEALNQRDLAAVLSAYDRMAR